MLNLYEEIDDVDFSKSINYYISVICNAGNNKNNYMEKNNFFYIKLKDNYKNISIHYDVIKRVVSSSSVFKFKIINPYKSNKLTVKHLKYLSEK